MPDAAPEAVPDAATAGEPATAEDPTAAGDPGVGGTAVPAAGTLVASWTGAGAAEPAGEPATAEAAGEPATAEAAGEPATAGALAPAAGTPVAATVMVE